MKLMITISALIFLVLSCHSQGCNKLPERFSSYSQAITLVQRSTFRISESANTTGSSWLNSAKYYSCDGIKGYLIYSTNKGYQYIHSEVPVNVWSGFIKAESKGSYYNSNIKYRYKLKLI